MKEYVPPEGSIPTLEVPDLSGVGAAHLVGIGGAGMSGIARILLAAGVRVSGSDLKESVGVVQLRALGSNVHVGHRAEQVGDVDAVVVSSAIPAGNPEVREAARRGIRVLARAQVLAALMGERRGIAVSGTHGKTTTTSMLAVALERSGADPTYVVGGDLNESGSNARAGRGPLFVAEADESDGSFLLLSPEVALVTNVEADHLDFYADLEDVAAAFATFCRQAERVVVCADDRGAARVVQEVGAPVVWYGEQEGAQVRLEAVEVSRGGSRCRLHVRAGDGVPAWEGQLELSVPGHQYLVNAAGALAAAALVGVHPRSSAEALRGYRGVKRRWDHRGTAAGADFVDDYAHHPTEVEATLAAAGWNEADRVVAVFQPHRYSRTAAMWRSLGESLVGADVVLITDVYGAGEVPVPGITGKLLVDALSEAAPGKRVVYLPHRAEVAAFLAREVRSGDLVLTLGAGDITVVGDETLSLLRAAGGR